ncbi:MAG TPA: tetratricopeptide repeat protein [Candidatus Obscuribacterales bacterium]
MAKPSDLAEGMQQYKAGNYAQALPLLEAAVKDDRNSSVAYYCLANTLMRLNKQKEALAAYEKAYELAPDSKIAAHCRMVLNRFGVQPKLDVARFEETKKEIQQKAAAEAAAGTAGGTAAGTAGGTAGAGAGAGAGAAAPTDPKVLEEERLAALKALAADLPKLKPIKKEDPSSNIPLGWDVDRKVEYIPGSYDRVWRAEQRAKEAECLLEQAKVRLKKDEPKAQDVKVDAKGKKAAATAPAKPDPAVEAYLAPFKKYLEDCNQLVKDERLIYERCQAARETVEGPKPDPILRDRDDPPILPQPKLEE